MTDKNIPDTRITLFGNAMDNPVIPASGTFGFGYGFTEWFDISILGSIALKGTTLEARYGNPLPRIAECPAGMINAIGLQNPGAVAVRDVELKKLAAVYPKKVIANVGGHSFREYTEASRILSGAEEVFAIELNVSCPNVKGGGMAFGLDPAVLEELTAAVKEVSEKPVVVKLSPNVTDITVLAKAAERGGADGLSLINTLVGMRIDLNSARPIISVKRGGYSGPGVFPVAINAVYNTREAVNLPIIGMGGIMNAENVIEMMYAGADAVMVGTLNLIDPLGSKKIIEDLPGVMERLGIDKLTDIVGRAHR